MNTRILITQMLEALEILNEHTDTLPREFEQELINTLSTAREYLAAPEQSEPKRFHVLAVTTAYEQGVGKGHQAFKRGNDIENPYAEPGDCGEAWRLGYQEGKVQAKDSFNYPAPQPKAEPVAWPTLTQDERAALERFDETCQDGQQYDVPKAMMMRLSEIGVVYHLGRQVYCFTEVGRATIDAPQPKAEPVNQMMLDALKPFQELFKQAVDKNPSPVNIDCQIAMRDLRALVYAFDAAAEQAPQPAELTTYSTCNETLRSQGKPYPRTCAKCGLGKCVAAQGAKK